MCEKLLLNFMKQTKSIPKNAKSKQLARNLRKNSTKEENHLWYDFLKTYPVQFHRQYVIENYIVDFFSPKACVVIELDGSQHYEKTAIAYDKERTRLLETYGFTVLRYTNLDIDKRFKEVCEDIHLHIQKNLGYDPYSKR